MAPMKFFLATVCSRSRRVLRGRSRQSRRAYSSFLLREGMAALGRAFREALSCGNYRATILFDDREGCGALRSTVDRICRELVRPAPTAELYLLPSGAA